MSVYTNTTGESYIEQLTLGQALPFSCLTNLELCFGLCATESFHSTHTLYYPGPRGFLSPQRDETREKRKR